MCVTFGVQGSVADMIGVDYLGQSSQMSMVACIQFICSELVQSPDAAVVQLNSMDVSIVELHFEGEIHTVCSPHTL